MKRFFLSLAVVFLSFPLFSLNLEDFSLSVEPLFGMKWGQVDEYVFTKKSNFSDDKLSELNWEIKPEWYCGVKFQSEWKSFFAETGLKIAVPGEAGKMMDSDWLNAQTSNMSGGVSSEKAAGHDYKTCYSEHDNNLDYDVSFEIKGGYEFNIREIFKIKPSVGFEYDNIKFTGYNGTGWYGYGKDRNFYTNNRYYAAYDDEENQRVEKFSGRVITYKRISDYIWLGSDFSADFYGKFLLKAGFFFAPYVYAVSYDSHLERENYFADLTTGFFSAFKCNFGMEYKITGRHSILINANYFYMSVIRGDDYEKSSASTTYTLSSLCDGGAGAKYLDINLSYRFKIF